MRLALGVVGCTELVVERLPVIPPNDPLVGALAYYLPRTAITVNGTLTLASCTVGEVPELTVSVALTPVISYEPDPAHHFSIPYENASRWTADADLSVQNSPSGTLQSFNATIADQVGPTIVAALGAAAQIGSAISVANQAAIVKAGGTPVPCQQ